MSPWNNTTPIFLQIRQRLIEMILAGTIAEGEAMPSVRQMAVDLEVNPLTATKAYQSLVELEVIEKKRGLGMYVAEGARARLLAHERERFLTEDWPHIHAQIKALGLDLSRLLAKGAKK